MNSRPIPLLAPRTAMRMAHLYQTSTATGPIAIVCRRFLAIVSLRQSRHPPHYRLPTKGVQVVPVVLRGRMRLQGGTERGTKGYRCPSDRPVGTTRPTCRTPSDQSSPIEYPRYHLYALRKDISIVSI